ncbi:MAG: two-component regulator propeller domain-containing protein [Bacteroidales bacterium]
MKKIIVTLLSLIAALPLFSSGNSLYFKHLSVENGLSQSTVRAIAQDRQGNIWMGTQNGLNRYDGYRFDHFLSDLSDSTKIADNSIFSLCLDSVGKLWIGTSSVFSCYDFKEQRFYNYTLPGGRKHHIADILETESGFILSTDAGLLTFRSSDSGFTVEPSFSGLHVRTVAKYDAGYLVATSDGLFSYSPGGKVAKIEGFEDFDISSIEPSGSTGFWIGTFGQGLFRTDASFGIIRHFGLKDGMTLPSDNIRVLNTDSYGHLWVGTYDGLAVYDDLNGTFRQYFHDKNSTSLSHNSVWSIFMDNQKGVWVGTYFGGVNYYNRQLDNFRIVSCPYGSETPVYGFVSCVENDASSEALWIGTNDDGVFKYDIPSGVFRQFNSVTLNASGTMSDNIKCVIDDGRGGIWIGTHLGGLSHLTMPSARLETYVINRKSPINNGCYSLLDEGDGTLWVGTLGGLLSFDKASKTFSTHSAALIEPMLASLQIMDLFRDSQGNVWIGTDAGLFRYSKGGNSVRTFETMSPTVSFENIFVTCLTEGTDSKVWVGTNRGLFCYDAQSNSFESYTTADGLPDNSVYGIIEDDSKMLWLSTGAGLSCFDPATRHFRNYVNSEGISNNEFTMNAFCKGKDGYFNFGGHNGVTRFRPLDIMDNTFTPAAHISDISIFNGQASPLGTFKVARNDDGSVGKARISSRNDIVNISFSVFNMVSEGRNLFSYCLEGFDSKWFETTGREVSYSNLSPGKYVFRLKAANNDGKWSNEVTELSLRILPRWWQTAFARFFFVLIALCFAGVVVMFILNKARMNMRLDMEHKEKERIDAMGKERVNFFINLSHELRTPLTLILSPLNEIEEHGGGDNFVKTRLEYVRRSSMRLMHIVNQMLGYRKMELGLMKLHVQTADLDKIAGDCFSLFEDEAAKRDVDYIFDSKLNGDAVPFDSNVVDTILLNLLSNAFKFTPRGGVIKLSLIRSVGNVSISVENTGIGIPTDKRAHVFDLFYQADENVSGSGIGLAIVKRLTELHHGTVSLDSKEGRYTHITVSIPDNEEAYSDDEKVSRTSETSPANEDNLPYYLADVESSGSDPNPEEVGSQDSKTDSILIVEADVDFRKYISDCFSGSFRITAVTDGRNALDIIKSDEPDIIIADRNLPGLDGWKLCQSVKRNIQTCHIPVVILGTKDGNEEKRSNIEAGADAYIAQPFTAAMIRAEVAGILKTRDRLRNHYSTHPDIDDESLVANGYDAEFLKKAKQVVEDNIDNDAFTSNDFADAMCMSRSNLYLKITSITGDSATQFIRKIRFDKACRMLLERNYSIAEISSMVGFSSPSYFSTSFKKFVGCLPTEYGKKAKE